MIGKVARLGSSFLGAMQYCYYETRTNHSLDRSRIRGELIYAQHLSLTMVTDDRVRTESKRRLNLEALATSMQAVAGQNDRTRKPVWHQSFSFPVGECPPVAVMASICQSFARTFGMENNPLVAFRHRDREHEHFHIIASRIDLDGKNTAKTSFNYREVGRFCRAMEERHGLTPGPPMAYASSPQHVASIEPVTQQDHPCTKSEGVPVISEKPRKDQKRPSL